jgi:hypothetical protein
MAVELVGFKGTTFIVQGWDVTARPGQFVEVNVRLVASVFGDRNVDVESIASALTKSLNNPEIQKTITKQVGIELDQQRVIDL